MIIKSNAEVCVFRSVGLQSDVTHKNESEETMTTQERETAFKTALAAAERQYGVAMRPIIVAEKLGEAVLHRPGLALIDLVASGDWTPPIEGQTEKEEEQNGGHRSR